MTSQWQNVDMPLTGGVNEKTRPEALPQGSFSSIVNLVQTRDGAFVPRAGFQALTQATAPSFPGLTYNASAIARVMGLRGQACAVDTTASTGAQLIAYSPTAGMWSQIGRVPEPTATRIPIAGVTASVLQVDVAYVNGYIVVAWVAQDTAAGGVYVGRIALLDAATYQRVCPDALVWGPTPTVKLAVVGTVAVVVSSNGTGSILGMSIDTSTATSIASGWSGRGSNLPNATDADSTASFGFDTLSGGGTKFYVAYTTNAGGGGNTIRVRAYDASLTQVDTMVLSTGAGTLSPALGGADTDRIWLGWGLAAAVQVVGLNPANLAGAPLSTMQTVYSVAGGAARQVSILGLGSGTGQVFAIDVTGTPGNLNARAFITNAGAVTAAGTQRVTYRTVPTSRPFLVGGRTMMHVQPMDATANSSSQGMLALADVMPDVAPPLRPVSLPAARLSVALPVWNQTDTLCHAARIGTSLAYVVPMVSRKSSAAGSSVGISSGSGSVDLVIYDATVANQWQPVAVGDAACFGGGVTSYYDGAGTAELGFWVPPEIVSIAQGSKTGSGLTVGDTYQYVAVYEMVDASGLVHWSVPSAPVSFGPVASTHETVTVTVTTLMVTSRENVGVVRVVLYRKDASVGGLFQRVPSSETYSDPTVTSVAIVDGNANTLVATQPYLYTESGAQPRMIPPSLPILTVHGDRLVGVDETGKNIWFSGQYTYGEAPWFTSLFQFPVDKGGVVTGLASMDGRLYIFKRDAIWYVDGDGPSDNGNNPYALPQEIPAGVGCIEPRSVVVTPLGICFQSDQGIYLLDRSHAAQFIGRGVEQTTLTTWPVITSATLDEVHGRVYFTCTASPATAGGRVVYDYIHNTWTTDRVGWTGTVPVVPVSAAIVQSSTGPAIYVAAPNKVWAETPNAYMDTDAFAGVATSYSCSFVTGWIKMGGEQGFWRARDVTLLNDRIGDGHGIVMSIGYNYDPSYVDVRTFTNTQIDAFTTAKEQMGVSCSRQKVEAFRVSVTLTRNTNQGAALLGLSFTVAQKGGTFRLPAAQQQ